MNTTQTKAYCPKCKRNTEHSRDKTLLQCMVCGASGVNIKQRAQWPDLSKDQKAVELAKVAMGWEDLTIEDQMDSSRKLVELAQIYKGKL